MIRAATRADVDALLAMGQVFLETTAYRRLLHGHSEAGRGTTERLIDGPDSAVFVAQPGDSIVGCIGVFVGPHPLTGDRVANEVMWWVNPDARGIGLRLLTEAERWAAAHGAVALTMIAPSPTVGEMYERLGFVEVERCYQKGL